MCVQARILDTEVFDARFSAWGPPDQKSSIEDFRVIAVYICVYVYVYIYTHIVYIHMYVNTRRHIPVFTYVYIYIYICINIRNECTDQNT